MTSSYLSCNRHTFDQMAKGLHHIDASGQEQPHRNWLFDWHVKQPITVELLRPRTYFWEFRVKQASGGQQTKGRTHNSHTFIVQQGMKWGNSRFLDSLQVFTDLSKPSVLSADSLSTNIKISGDSQQSTDAQLFPSLRYFVCQCVRGGWRKVAKEPQNVQ